MIRAEIMLPFRSSRESCPQEGTMTHSGQSVADVPADPGGSLIAGHSSK